MSQKYFIISESELEQIALWTKIEVACRAREVPEWAEYFAGSQAVHGQFESPVRLERIKK